MNMCYVCLTLPLLPSSPPLPPVPPLPPLPPQSHLLGDLTEVPLPVRFIYLLLGPDDGVLDYHEIGRAMATLMSDKVGGSSHPLNPLSPSFLPPFFSLSIFH